MISWLVIATWRHREHNLLRVRSISIAHCLCGCFFAIFLRKKSMNASNGYEIFIRILNPCSFIDELS